MGQVNRELLFVSETYWELAGVPAFSKRYHVVLEANLRQFFCCSCCCCCYVVAVVMVAISGIFLSLAFCCRFFFLSR